MPSGCAADLTKAIFAWPVYATWNAAVDLKSRQGPRAKALTALAYVPVLLITTAIWAAGWTAAYRLLMLAFGGVQT
jgi:hypothetical protein